MSKRAEHTPGRWEIFEGQWYEREMVITTPGRLSSSIVPVCEINVEFDGDIGVEQVANARLIAAAPDLLEVAKTALLYANSKGNDLLSNMAERAIAKATGADHEHI